MDVRRILLASLGVVVVCASVPAGSQTLSKLMIASPCQAGVSLSLYDPAGAATPAFEKLFQDDPDIARLRPFSAVLTNVSEKNIVALTLQWTLSDSSSQQRVLNYRTDSLFPLSLSLSSGPIAPVGENILVTPSFLLRESVLKSGAGFITVGKATVRSDAERFETSSAVRVDLDTIIFEDGQVCGADRSNTVAQIQARKSAADALSSAVLAMLNDGRDPSAMLTEITTERGISSQDYVGVWKTRLAQMLLRSRNLKKQAEALSAVPAISLYRINAKEGSQP